MDPKRWSHIDIELDLDLETDSQDRRVCDHPDCDQTGEHKAPKNRSNLRDYYHLCFEHVQAYNRSWNYYDGMDESQIEASRRADVTWQRQTWPMGANAHAGAADPATSSERNWGEATDREFEDFKKNQKKHRSQPNKLDDLGDPFGLFSGAGWQSTKSEQQRDRDRAYQSSLKNRFSSDIVDALTMFGLTLPLEKQTLRARYKVLAKQLHPDSQLSISDEKMSLQSKDDKEELFKRLNASYEVLKDNLLALST